METPVGNPNQSLLPQPAVPTPIEPMRGGSIGGGAETVSLLPQPSIPTQIEPMRGGGDEDISLLPQPAQPVPIQPMKGGARDLELKLKPFIGAVSIKEQNPSQILKQEFVNKYVDYRNKFTWKQIDKSLRKKDMNYRGKIDDDTIFFVYHVSTELQFLTIRQRIINRIRDKKTDASLKDKQYIFIIYFDELKEPLEAAKAKELKDAHGILFERIYRLFIISFRSFIEIMKKNEEDNYNINEEFEIFFLYKRSKARGITAIRGQNELKKFEYFEPLSVCFSYEPKESKESKGICFLTDTTILKDKDTKTFVKLYPSAGGGIKQLDGISKEGKPISINLTQLEAGDYYISTPWEDKYWHISFGQDIPERDEIQVSTSGFFGKNEQNGENTTKPPATSKPPAVTTTTAATPPPPPPKKPTVPPQVPSTAKPAPKLSFLVKGKQTIRIPAGGNEYEIRKATTETIAAWKKGEFSEEEQMLFDAIGINKKFIEDAKKDPAKQEIIDGRPEFLSSLVLTSCLKDSKYLLSIECDFLRNYLTKLFQIRFLDRLRGATQFMTQVTDFEAQVQMDKLKQPPLKPPLKPGRVFSSISDLVLDQLLQTNPLRQRIQLPVFDIPIPFLPQNLQNVLNILSSSFESIPAHTRSRLEVDPSFFVLPGEPEISQVVDLLNKFFPTIQLRSKPQILPDESFFVTPGEPEISQVARTLDSFFPSIPLLQKKLLPVSNVPSEVKSNLSIPKNLNPSSVGLRKSPVSIIDNVFWDSIQASLGLTILPENLSQTIQTVNTLFGTTPFKQTTTTSKDDVSSLLKTIKLEVDASTKTIQRSKTSKLPFSKEKPELIESKEKLKELMKGGSQETIDKVWDYLGIPFETFDVSTPIFESYGEILKNYYRINDTSISKYLEYDSLVRKIFKDYYPEFPITDDFIKRTYKNFITTKFMPGEVPEEYFFKFFNFEPIVLTNLILQSFQTELNKNITPYFSDIKSIIDDKSKSKNFIRKILQYIKLNTNSIYDIDEKNKDKYQNYFWIIKSYEWKGPVDESIIDLDQIPLTGK